MAEQLKFPFYKFDDTRTGVMRIGAKAEIEIVDDGAIVKIAGLNLERVGMTGISSHPDLESALAHVESYMRYVQPTNKESENG